jgi:outer membrane receptor protein involved in Fe transport
VLNLLACQPASGATVDLDDDWDELTGKLSLNYQLNDDQLVYLGFSQGYQSGGYRTLCFGNLTAACGGTPFDPQTVDSIEAGWKAELFDNRLRLNAVAFYAMYEDIQQVVTNFAGGFPIDNIGDVDVYGLELEILWAPIDDLNVYANLGIQESDFGSVSPLSPPGGLGDSCVDDPTPPCATPTDELPSNPKWQGKIGFDYTIPLDNSLAFFYGLDIFHSDDYYSEARNLIEIDSYTRLNGFIGFRCGRPALASHAEWQEHHRRRRQRIGHLQQRLRQYPHAAATRRVHAELQGQLLRSSLATALTGRK